MGKNTKTTDMKTKQSKLKLSVLIPVFNEGINLKIMLKILKVSIDVSHEVLVIYDILDDNSIPVVKALQIGYPNLNLIHNKLGRGVINAIRSGVNSSKGDYVVIIAADDVGPVLSFEDMTYLMDKGCDMVSATRYAHGGRVIGGMLTSRIFSRTLSKILYTLKMSSLTDSTIGIKMFKPSTFNNLNLNSKPVGWAFALELSLKAQQKKLKLGEVPIISINRFYGGKSSFKLKSWMIEYIKWFFWGLKNLSPIKPKEPAMVKIPTHTAK